MRQPKARVAVAVGATALVLGLLAGCGGGDRTSTPTSSSPSKGTGPPTTARPATPSTTIPAAVLSAALLSAADVAGATADLLLATSRDLSACFPGSPLGVKDDPNEITGSDLERKEAGVDRTYGSRARVATPEQAAAYITTFASSAGSRCVTDALKAEASSDPTPPRVDASGLSGTAAPIPVADGGALLSVKGDLVVGTAKLPVGFDLIAFHKGPTLVLLTVGAYRGGTVPNEAVELAQKVAGRLP